MQRQRHWHTSTRKGKEAKTQRQRHTHRGTGRDTGQKKHRSKHTADTAPEQRRLTVTSRKPQHRQRDASRDEGTDKGRNTVADKDYRRSTGIQRHRHR